MIQKEQRNTNNHLKRKKNQNKVRKRSENKMIQEKTKHIVNFSGGKDSTAMLIRMLEENIQLPYYISITASKNSDICPCIDKQVLWSSLIKKTSLNNT